MIVLKKTYTNQEIDDIERDVCEAIEESMPHCDADGYPKGSVQVTVAYIDE
tara:strand:- start:6591 stop:6743 length:153 start_codon:yes stop_codon:yes gene_type:complete